MARPFFPRLAILGSAALLALAACDNAAEQTDAEEAGRAAIEAETAAAPPAAGEAPAGAAGGVAAADPEATQAAPVQVSMGSGTVQLLPSSGPVGEEVRITGTGLAPGTGGAVLGGTDPAQLAPLADASVDGSGALRAIVTVPDTAENGSEFLFALKLGDTVSPPLAYRVQSREPDQSSN